MSRIESDKLTTPKLRVLYNSLHTPYYHVEKGVTSKKGKYSITLVAFPAEINDFQDRMDEVHDSLIARLCEQEGKKKIQRKEPLGGIYPQLDKEQNETGDYCIRLSHADKGLNSKTGKEWDIKVKVFDAQAKPVNADVIRRIGRGSTVRCNFKARVYYTNGIAGIAYDLVATQLLVPVWYDGGDVGGADFEPVEDGYVASADEQQEF